MQIELSKLFVSSESYELLADLETPVSTFCKICNNQPYSFLLESVEGGENLGRYSLIGTEPILTITSTNNKTYLKHNTDNKTIELESNPFIALDNILKNITVVNNDNNSFLGFFGFFGYENIRWIESKIKLTTFTNLPDVCLTFPGKLIIFDHVLHKVKLIVNVLVKNKNTTQSQDRQCKEKLESFLRDFTRPQTHKLLSLKYDNDPRVHYTSNFTKEQFCNIVKKAKDYIYQGDILQAVISQKLKVKGNHDGFILYRALRSINPSPYLFYLNYKDFEIAGSSPEVMVKCEPKNSFKIASLRPIAGTYPRGKDANEDKKNIYKLQNDKKEKAEHLMLVDLARNDLGRVCEFGTVNVPELMTIEKYSQVLHIVSQVEGVLNADKSAIDLLSSCFPAGTLSGAPKVRAMEIINELEAEQRGPYGGCIGFFGFNDTINTCMTIRTFIIYKDYLEIQVGAGIVADSDPENEYQETLRKGAALLKAVSLVY